MNAEYADYDGKPHVTSQSLAFLFRRAYRTAAEYRGLDAAWNGSAGSVVRPRRRAATILPTMRTYNVYAIDGTAVDE